MCFTVEASFISSAALGVAGIAAFRMTKASSQAAFAGIIVLFSVQQMAEGILWLSFSDPAFLPVRQPATHVFVILALVVWPVWIPLSVWLSEQDKSRKKILSVLLALGVGVGLMMLYIILFYEVQAQAGAHHLTYSFGSEYMLKGPRSMVYFVPCVVAPFVASNRRVWFFWTRAVSHLCYHPTYLPRSYNFGLVLFRGHYQPDYYLDIVCATVIYSTRKKRYCSGLIVLRILAGLNVVSA